MTDREFELEQALRVAFISEGHYLFDSPEVVKVWVSLPAKKRMALWLRYGPDGFNKKTIARHLGVHRRTIYSYIRDGLAALLEVVDPKP